MRISHKDSLNGQKREFFTCSKGIDIVETSKDSWCGVEGDCSGYRAKDGWHYQWHIIRFN